MQQETPWARGPITQREPGRRALRPKAAARDYRNVNSADVFEPNPLLGIRRPLNQAAATPPAESRWVRHRVLLLLGAESSSIDFLGKEGLIANLSQRQRTRPALNSTLPP
jgi:hypothetical protein